ncbi:MAG: EpsG family protein [Lachnospiraceae bacterium]|nr:EpsG family protein [Lachnospiraceae bacterium]
MILYLIVAVGTIMLAAMVNNHPPVQSYRVTRQQLCNRICLVSIFTILFLLSACRQNVGNDYAKYVEFMHLVNCDAYVPTEPGFNLLVKIIYGLSGFENYLLVFAVYAFVTILFFLLAIYEQSDTFSMTYFLFMALGYYFQTFSTVRYYLALALALYSMKFVLRRQWGKFVALVILGSFFHKSLLVILPLYYLASVTWRKWQLVLMGLFCTTFLFFQDFYLQVVVFLYPTYEDTEYLEGGTSYINILRCLAVLVLALFYYQRSIQGNRRMQFYFYLNLGALVLYVFCSFLPIISRIGYYLTISHIFFLPALLGETENVRLRKLLQAGMVCAAALYFVIFMSRAYDDGLLILPYKTFFFHDMVNILSDMN